MDGAEDLGLGRWDVSKRSPDERSDIRDFLYRSPHIAALIRATGSLDLVDPPQILIDPRLPSGAASLVFLDHLAG
jgi:hypothetical protein